MSSVTVAFCKKLKLQHVYLTLKTPTPENGKTHSNNSSATADHFLGLALKGLM